TTWDRYRPSCIAARNQLADPGMASGGTCRLSRQHLVRRQCSDGMLRLAVRRLNLVLRPVVLDLTSGSFTTASSSSGTACNAGEPRVEVAIEIRSASSH